MACHKLRRRRYVKTKFLRKKSFRNSLLREIQMDFMFEILRSILPRPNQKKMVVPTAPSSQIISTPSSNGGSKDASALDIKGTEENAIDERMESIDSTDGQPLNLPAVRIEQPGGSDQLLIRIITLKRSTHLTSKLFEVLEEENLDVFHVNRFCVQEKILHTIQVKKQMVVSTAPSSQIISTPSSNGGSKDALALDIKGTEENTSDERMESIDSIDGQPLNLSAVRIEQPGGSDQRLIRIITLKRSTHLTSKLFEVLEEENMDIFHVNRFCIQEKILHTIQVKVLMPSKLDTDGLRRKLCSWAAAKRAE